jgi:hypothetical protein
MVFAVEHNTIVDVAVAIALLRGLWWLCALRF